MTPNSLGLIGGGNMAEAIIRGLLTKRVCAPSELAVSDVSEARLGFLRGAFPGVTVVSESAAVLAVSQTVLFAVKPQTMPSLLPTLAPSTHSSQLFLSICAGTRCATIEAGLSSPANPHPRVVRIMPNTPALIGLGVAGICGGAHATADDLALAQRLFEAVGTVTMVPEAMMDAVTALTGSGPAYVFYLMESLIDGAVAVGFDRAEADRMVRQLLLGSATLAAQSDKSPEELRRAVTSPGGTTAAGVAVLEAREVKAAVVACVAAAEARGRELGAR